MKLSLSYKELGTQLGVDVPDSERIIRAVAFDTRRIVDGTGILFFALEGEFRDGHDFIRIAYEKKVRTFIVSKKIDAKEYPGAVFLKVDNTLKALQKIAKAHREKFSTPVIAITGSAGKTIVKEWLGQVLETKYRIVRSPKSYNSQLGVALSLLEINAECDITIIEAGISGPGEMAVLADMIQPTHGIFTSLGSAHSENFASRDQQMAEKLLLFEDCPKVFIHHTIPFDSRIDKFFSVHEKSYKTILENLPFQDEISRHNAAIVIAASRAFDVEDEVICERLQKLDRVPLRLETFDGINDSIIINDTYNLDLDAFRSSLEYQLSIAKGKPRVVIVGTNEEHSAVEAILKDFEPIEYHFVSGPHDSIPEFSNAVVLIKGKRTLHMEQLALRVRAKKHQTYLEINLAALRSNISYYKSNIPAETKVLAMVKASSYGSGIDDVGKYLERIGIDYLGVAYADEGVQLRNAGVQVPILVMNTEEAGFADCVLYNLEPCIYSTEQLDDFIRRLIYEGKTDYPIHLKLETGMNRLGFLPDEIPGLIRKLSSQTEVRIKSVYSHLATSDDPNSSFVHKQAERFQKISDEIRDKIPYSFDRHILNSEGILNYPEYHFDMVRIGIGMYGQTSHDIHKPHLSPVISWYSAVSQTRDIVAGQSVGYGQSEAPKEKTRIAIIPVGYGDGFRRMLSQGKGGVYIRGKWCPVIGNVCMDMIMVNVGEMDVQTGEVVEIIGPNQTLESMAKRMQTIPYEVLTGISRRVHRVYIDA